jgi:hypothetical protein
MCRALVAAFFCCACSIPAAAQVPEEVDQRLSTAVAPADGDAFVGSYTMVSRTTVQKPNGKARQEVEVVLQVERRADGDETIRLLRFTDDGEDKTEERRRKIEQDRDDRRDGDDQSDDAETESEDFIDPFGDTAGRFRFAGPRHTGEIMEIDFEPRPEYADQQGMSRGTLAWHARTLDPLWIEYVATAPPKPMRELSARIEYSRQGDTLYVSGMVFEGLAKVLLLKRHVHTDVRWHDITPAPEAPTDRLSGPR